MKKVKIKWLNVGKLILFIFCIGNISHDLYMVTLYSYISGSMYGWSSYGFLTFILFCIVAIVIYEDFEEQTKSTQPSRQTYRKGTNK